MVAEKFFGGNKSNVGKSLENANGVLLSRSSLPADFANNWGSFGFFTYVLLKPNTNPLTFEKKLLLCTISTCRQFLLNLMSRCGLVYSPFRQFTFVPFFLKFDYLVTLHQFKLVIFNPIKWIL